MQIEVTPQIQSGVLAYRRKKAGKIELVLVKKPHSQNWGIPKGKLEPNLSPAENAAKEAFEEAGLRGQIKDEPLGSYRALKRVADRKLVVEVTVFLMEVTAVARKWPEQATRLVKWCTPIEAAQLLREPFLVQFCQTMESHVLPR